MAIEMTEGALIKVYISLLEKFQNKHLADFVKYVMNQTPKYWTAPGASKPEQHHCFVGGLAYHSIMAAKLGEEIATHYAFRMKMPLNIDLIITGILLHDIGKSETYDLAPQGSEAGNPAFGDEPGFLANIKNRTFHHIPIGFEMISRLASVFGLDSSLRDELLHIILSHHGNRAWSSPVIPQTIEAYIVHAVEMMDGYVDKYNRHQDIKDLYSHG